MTPDLQAANTRLAEAQAVYYAAKARRREARSKVAHALAHWLEAMQGNAEARRLANVRAHLNSEQAKRVAGAPPSPLDAALKARGKRMPSQSARRGGHSVRVMPGVK